MNMLVMEALIKKKRTKRRRVSTVIHPRLALTLASGKNEGVSITATSSSSTSSSSDNSDDFDHEIHAINSTTTEEEEDMANCLILLAQGRYDHDGQRRHVSNDVVYQCKTCDRVFASFQALGGHRASHKKPKPNNNNNNIVEEEIKNISKTTTFREGFLNNRTSTNTVLSLQISSGGVLGISNSKSNNKVHECSICGAEFTSGQALGGHMRKHRTTASFHNQTTSTSSPDRSSSQEPKKPRNALELDLNLPAPDLETKFPFASSGNEQVIVFSASPLVDVHY